MACCALAVFLIGQLYAWFGAVRDRLGRRAAPRVTSAAAAWRPAVLVASNAPKVGLIRNATWRQRSVFAAFLLSFVGLGTAIAAHASDSVSPIDIRARLADPANWCGAPF